MAMVVLDTCLQTPDNRTIAALAWTEGLPAKSSAGS
jgi:hypothetical protein